MTTTARARTSKSVPAAPSLVLVALALVGLAAGCGGAIVHTRADASSLIPHVSAVLALSPRLGFGRIGDQRRVARRTADMVIQATGGHAILGDELPSVDPELIADGLRTLGEDPEQILTFSVIGARSERVEGSGIGGVHAVRRFADYVPFGCQAGRSPGRVGQHRNFRHRVRECARG